jgi:hypothetical protein
MLHILQPIKNLRQKTIFCRNNTMKTVCFNQYSLKKENNYYICPLKLRVTKVNCNLGL